VNSVRTRSLLILLLLMGVTYAVPFVAPSRFSFWLPIAFLVSANLAALLIAWAAVDWLSAELGGALEAGSWLVLTLLAVGSAVAAATLGTMVLWGALFFPSHESGLPFSPENWRAADPDTRSDQARDYLARIERGGVTLQQVLQDLGPPDQVREGWTYTLPSLAAPRREDLPACGHLDRRHRTGLELAFGLGRTVEQAWAIVPEPAVASGFLVQSWNAASYWASADDAERAIIVWELARGGQLLGLHQGQVLRLLGEPSSRDGGLKLDYDVGTLHTWVDVDPHYLTVFVDEHDRATGGELP
jgi:hypothetical protein